MMIYRCVLAVAARVDDLRAAVGRRSEHGGSTVEWVVIAAVVFLLAVAVGSKITTVVNEHLAKIK
ncbi:hypothetical protein [Spongiactinospora sp. TRM90649]|uniref:hypothetical protein n=1 Tax=Spongiactinospora sp. TRM90649 TaxID=3031114 RepID=UPI0023F8308B|nr:hypothetical protein [Spongiactinospora sp. TRM90649]MDF5759050.1 hypothetical protein [Spongiactinospora sp. TRM90649]